SFLTLWLLRSGWPSHTTPVRWIGGSTGSIFTSRLFDGGLIRSSKVGPSRRGHDALSKLQRQHRAVTPSRPGPTEQRGDFPDRIHGIHWRARSRQPADNAW